MIVVDASVAVQWVVPEPGFEFADAVLQHRDLIAPDLLLIEVGNALRRKLAANEVTPDQIDDGFALISDSVRLMPVDLPRIRRSFALSQTLNHSIYDCLYIVVAEETDGRIVTRDEQLRRRMVAADMSERLVDLKTFLPQGRAS